jgi:FkbM family methyltransferase
MVFRQLRDAFGLSDEERYRRARRIVKRYEGNSNKFDRNGEAWLLRAMAPLSPRVVFDVGAHIGEWSQAARAALPEADIHAFELTPDTFETLRANVSDPRVTLNPFGLSDADGTMTFKDYGDNSGGNSTVLRLVFQDRERGFTLREGQLRAGSSYCAEHGIDRIDLMKIDVEGAESMVLRGFAPLLERQAIGVIQFEYGYAAGDMHMLMRDYYDLFEGWGYVVGPLKRTGVLFRPFEYRLNDFTSGPNYVAVPAARKDLRAALQGAPIPGYLD